jgi:hypothetical protein
LQFARENAEAIKTSVKLPSGLKMALEGFNETGDETGIVTLAKNQTGIVKVTAPKNEYVGGANSTEKIELVPANASKLADKDFDAAFAALAFSDAKIDALMEEIKSKEAPAMATN